VKGSLAAAGVAGIAGRRSSTWWLLSRLVTELPNGAWLNELEGVLASVDPDPEAVLGPESAALLKSVREVLQQADGLTMLGVDRTKLLAGVLQKGALPAPYESAVQGQPMNSDLVIDVIDCYRETGLEDFGSELGPPDYLGTELRFMALLAYREMQAHQAGDAGQAILWLSRQRRFLDDHVLRWVPAHCERLGAIAGTSFYAAAFRLLAQACLLDRSDLDQVSAMMNQPQPDHAAMTETGA
jgi:putative dimethyl sulfoxide reductase chaperone